MRSSNNPACAPRARDAGTLLAAALLIVGLAIVAASVTAKAQDAAKTAGDTASIVGTWQAVSQGGVRVGTLTIVQNGDGLAGAFVGYDYDKPVDLKKPVEGTPPKVAMRTGSLLSDVKLDGNQLTFKLYLRHPSPPPGKPAGFELSGEVKLQGGDAAELRLSAPHKPEPMIMKLTRD
jgi:hypothetical protein